MNTFEGKMQVFFAYIINGRYVPENMSGVNLWEINVSGQGDRRVSSKFFFRGR